MAALLKKRAVAEFSQTIQVIWVRQLLMNEINNTEFVNTICTYN